MTAPVRVYIALAFYNEVYPEVIDCVTSSTTPTVYGPETRIRSSSIDLARSELAGRFLEWRSADGQLATHMMCVDSDTWWSGDAITRLVRCGGDMVCAAYRTRIPPYAFQFRYVDGHSSLSTAPVRRTPGGNVLEIANTGIGCCLIKREVIESMYFRHPELSYYSYDYPSNPKRVHLFQKFIFRDNNVPRGFGEDYSFQERARKCGFKLELLPSIVTFHAGMPGQILSDVLEAP
jgi:hypothetical protein